MTKRILMAVNMTGAEVRRTYYVSGKVVSESDFDATIKGELMAKRLAPALTQSTGFGYRVLWAEPAPAKSPTGSQWMESAASVLDVLEESAALVPGGVGKLSDYITDSGLMTCRALRAPFRFELALNGEPISRAHALELIAARMESRLS